MEDKIISFHVHLPANIEKLGGYPVVIGDGSELGEWEYNTVCLYRPNPSINPTYWISKDIKLTRSENLKIQYNYAIYIPAAIFRRSKKIIHEGKNGSDESLPDSGKRLLNLGLKRQFDIWKNGNCSELEQYQINEDISDYAFVDYIYNNVSTQNLKESVLEYEALLTLHTELTIKGSNYDFIFKNVNESSRKEQKLFLCLLLGHHVSRQDSFILPEEFKSEILINVFKDFQKNILLSDQPSSDQSSSDQSDVIKIMFKAILCLIQHNSLQYKFEWLVIFKIAKEIDLTYSFLEILKDLNYSCSDFKKFSEEMKKMESCINDIGYENAIKIAKWLSKLCKDTESIIVAWNNPLILNKQLDNQILQCFTERTQKFISDDDVHILTNRSQELQEFRGSISAAVRNKALSLLEDPMRAWSYSNAHDIIKLFQDYRLNWSNDEIIISLELISKSQSSELLDIFPALLDCWFNQGFSDSKGKNIPNISKNWFAQLLNKLDSGILVIFLKLETIYPLLGCRKNIWNNFSTIVVDKMKTYSESQILNEIKFVFQIKIQEVIELYLNIIKRMLNKTIRQISDKLVDKILMICDCKSDSSLVIPNTMCEEIICYIITRLQDQSLLPNSERYLNVIQSIKYSKFWFLILNATGSVKQLYESPYIQDLRTSALRINELLLTETISMKLLQQLLKYSDEEIFQYFHIIIDKKSTSVISQDKIVEIRKIYDDYSHKLDILLKFYCRVCSNSKVTDVENYFHDIQQRMKSLDKINLKQVSLPYYWTIHEETLNSEIHIYKLIQSQSFQNIFEDRFQKDSDATNVNYITQKLLPIVFENYNDICKKYDTWENIGCSEALLFWKNVKNVNAEFDLTEELARRRNPKLIQTLEYLLKFPQWVERLERLIKLVKIFQIEYNESELSESICTIKSDSLMLEKVIESIEKLEENFSNNKDYWNLIKELSDNKDLIKNMSEYNITNLFDVIDDYPDGNLVQYITTLSFAQVKQILSPLMNKHLIKNANDFIKELSTIIKKNSALSDNIILCNSNNMVLQKIYNKIMSREQDVKKIINNIIDNGTYIFVCDEKKNECTVTIKYASSTKDMYNLNDILDLYKKAVFITMDYKNDFMDLVDNIQKIIEILTKLMQRGHFDHQKSETKIQGVEDIKEFLVSLNEELERWNNIINQAQENHYHLTFFTAHHIFAFYNYFTSEIIDEENKDVCNMLVRFANSSVQLPSHKEVKEISCDFNDYLSETGFKLETILRDIPKPRRKIKIIQQEVILNDATSDGSFVVAYDDKLLVPNIIMSLYVNNGYYPEPWQLLLCSSSTTMEELITFIKRCVLASDNGYNNYLFCIVNLELLNFELQYHLVNYIKEMQLKNLNKNYSLALLCHRELVISHYIIDQHSLDVRKINGLNNETMQEIYRKLCPNVLCVTSDLSGQGKTEWIKESSFSKEKIPRSFLISDDMSFEYLMNKLKECKIKDIESLHINILSVNHPEDVNLFLFELLTFKIFSYKDFIVSIPETFIYIEIASSIKQNYLPMLKFLPLEHLSWNIENFKASQEIFSPIQVVCNYLKLYDYGKIDKKDILFNTSDVIKQPISTELCQNLLVRYFFNDEIISSYRNIEIFVNVLADQLIRLSSNDRFTINSLESNFGEKSNIRSIIVKSLIEVSKGFVTKSVKADQQIFTSDEDKNVYTDTISQLNNFNNINIIFFNPLKSNSLNILYQDKDKIPDDMELLLDSRVIDESIDDYNTMFSNEFLTQKSEYVLSSDNLTKMALILLRVNANIPVVICGETGCGKTSLITNLALMTKVQYQSISLYDGIEEETIIRFMSEALNKSEKEEIWILFDEINTCNHSGLLADLISNRMFQGKPIHPNIRLLATCNLYRPRVQNEGANIKKHKERSKHIYQVKPLPEQISDYIWYYDALKQENEYKYIQALVKNELKGLAQPVLGELILASQKFIRKVEEQYSVSLRDVKRVIELVKFFYNSLNNRPAYKKEHKYPSDGNPLLINRSYVLALSICYHSRLREQDLRKQYRYEISQIFQTHEIFMEEEIFIEIVQEEQEDYINRMQIPNNVVKNEALLEYILVMTVCILTKIPIFVIGETGSSKSLALHLISSNLRGLESNDDYFKSLPKVHVVAYLYSPNSTSDGIAKIFEKANKYQEMNPDIINVILLDNVGSNSLNSLKLLHTLLEPIYPETGPTVSFVGLSNSQLDISKSSRAILVQRPKHDLNDLVNINTKFLEFNQSEASESLAKAYLDYKQHNQALPNFYGLGDYYALLKMFSSSKLTPESIQIALARNFGGIENNVKLYELWDKYFGNFIKTFTDSGSWSYEQIPITQLIESNLNDSNSRNLMVIGKSESVVSLLTDQFKSKNMDPIVILGSHFPDDQDDYYSKVLNKIITCTGTGRPLILTNLERIYANLYNLWNQNNILIDNKENTEENACDENFNFIHHISLKCECIVVLDEKNLYSADPSLLDRFEKQKLSINDILNEKQRSLVQQLSDWAERISTFEDGSYKFTQKDLFIGFDNDETLQSLVLDITSNCAYADDNEILENCKLRLIALMTSDGIVRAERLILNPDEIDQLKHIYYNQHHDFIHDYFETLFDQENSLENSKENLMIINTFSHINTDIESCLNDLTTCQAYKLLHLKSEAQLSNLIENFYLISNDQMLILQCDKTVSIECINLAKFIIEKFQNEILDKKQIEAEMPVKYVCIINHIQQGQEQNLILSNFIHGWKQITIESLEQQNVSLSCLLGKSLYYIVNSELFSKIIGSSTPFEKILEDELLWCLSCIQYQISDDGYNNYSMLSKEILNDVNFVQCIKVKTFKWIFENCNDWQFEIAKNQDYLSEFTCFSLALQNYVKMIIKQTIAKLLYSLEKLSVTKTYFTFEKIDDDETKSELSELWKRCFTDNTIIDINNLPEPNPSRYVISYLVIDGLEFPFSYYFFNQINFYEIYYNEELDILRQNLNNIDKETKELHIELVENHIEDFKNKLLFAKSNFKMLQKYSELYYNDFIKILSHDIKKFNNEKELDFIIKHIIGDKVVSSPFLLHICWWKHAESILIQLQLIEMFPTIFEKIREDFIIHGMLDQILFKEAINIILQKIYCNEECEKEIDTVLSLVNKLNDTKKITRLPLLYICNELLKIKLIPLEKIKEVIDLGKDTKNQEFITPELIELVLNIMDNNNDLIVTNIRSFIMKSLEIIPFESGVRLILYKNIFSRKPFNLINEIIEKMFIDENQQNDGIFFTLINNPNEALQNSIRLNVINDCLDIKKLDTNIGEFCCEIIQSIFSKFELEALISYFPNCAENITENFALQQITVISFLKEFAIKFWERYVQDGNFSPESLIKTINEYLETKHPLALPFKSYFSLQQKRYSISTDQYKIITNIFPWIENIENDTNEEIIYPKFWRIIRQVNIEDFRVFHDDNFKYDLNNHPFTSVYFNHYEKLKLIRHLYPIVRFIKILNSKLEYRKTRKSAQMMTFNEFIEEESVDNTVNGNYLKSLFEGFVLSWNSVIDYIDQYQSKELSNKPFMNLECSVIYGLIEHKDAGIYLCAILEFLIDMHNEFLDNIFSIPVKFPEYLSRNDPAYFTKSIMITQAQEINFINYELDEKILKYSQRNLDQLDEISFNFDLQQVEMLLMKELVNNKVYFKQGNNNEFSFRHEIFNNSPRIFYDIRKVLQQEPIKTDRIKLFLAELQRSNSFISELLLFFEIILDLTRELAINNNEILIEDFIKQWLKLSRYNMMLTDICEEFSEFSLKHVIELYELIEEQDTNLFEAVINNIDDKFKIPLEVQMKESINNCIDYYNQSESLIPAKAFALALKRFIYRFLTLDSNIQNSNLTEYFLDFTLNLWPSYIEEKLVEKLFPTCLLVSHAYSCYIFIGEEIEEIKEKQDKEKKLKFKL